LIISIMNLGFILIISAIRTAIIVTEFNVIMEKVSCGHDCQASMLTREGVKKFFMSQ
jgi:hypothetical protein